MQPKVWARHEWSPWQEECHCRKQINQINESKEGEKLSSTALPKIILYPSTVNFSSPRYLPARLLSSLISYWGDSNLKRPPFCLSKLKAQMWERHPASQPSLCIPLCCASSPGPVPLSPHEVLLLLETSTRDSRSASWSWRGVVQQQALTAAQHALSLLQGSL